jgi:histidine triad (HIT) family protein
VVSFLLSGLVGLDSDFHLVFVPHHHRHGEHEQGFSHWRFSMTTTHLHSDSGCIFCKIIAGKIPSKVVFEDEEIYAFHDIHPWAPVHFLMIPKIHIASLAQVSEAHTGLLGRMMTLAPKLALQEGCNPYPKGGFRILSNTGDEGGQEVQHLHFHVIGGPRPWLKG